MLSQEAIQAAAERLIAVAHSPLKVILFGSYARGDADAGSDIDLLVVEREITDPVEEYLKLHRAASENGAYRRNALNRFWEDIDESFT